MRIESLIRRPSGTVVDMAGPGEPPRVYWFQSAIPGEPHTCEVDDPDDAARFLAIPEGYRRCETLSDVVPPEVPPKRSGKP